MVTTEGGPERVVHGEGELRPFVTDQDQLRPVVGQPGERELTVLFLDATDEALLRRFSSTRRPHPLTTTSEAGSEQGAMAVLDGIRIERTWNALGMHATGTQTIGVEGTTPQIRSLAIELK